MQASEYIRLAPYRQLRMALVQKLEEGLLFEIFTAHFFILVCQLDAQSHFAEAPFPE